MADTWTLDSKVCMHVSVSIEDFTANKRDQRNRPAHHHHQPTWEIYSSRPWCQLCFHKQRCNSRGSSACVWQVRMFLPGNDMWKEKVGFATLYLTRVGGSSKARPKVCAVALLSVQANRTKQTSLTCSPGTFHSGHQHCSSHSLH